VGTTTSAPVPPATFLPATRHAGCAATRLPDPACTPGADFASVTIVQVCVAGYSSSVRDVSTSTKNKVYAEYGVTRHPIGAYEVDHLVALELGGSNDIANLWPETASPRPGFHEKDKVENKLHQLVCAGAMSLADAQRQISTNWLALTVG
jgi:hypothetical protein